MNQRQKIILRLIRNIIIALASAVWIIPFTLSISFALIFLRIQEEILFDKEYEVWSFSYMEFSKNAFDLMVILLVVTVICWAFVAANKLWPIKGNPKDEQQQ